MGESEVRQAGPARWAAFRRFGELVRGGAINAVWSPEDELWFVDGGIGARRLVHITPDGQRHDALDLARLTKALNTALGLEIAELEETPFDSFSFADANCIRFSVHDRDVVLDLSTYGVRPVSARQLAQEQRLVPRPVRAPFIDGMPPTMEVASPDGAQWLSEVEHDLAVRGVVDDRLRRLTHDGTDGYAWSVDDAIWAPDGTRVIAAKRDSRDLPQLPVVHWLGPREAVDMFPFARSGDRGERAELHVVDVRAGTTTPLEIGDDEGWHLVPITWRADTGEALILAQDEQLTRLRVLATDGSPQLRVLIDDVASLGEMNYARVIARRSALHRVFAVDGRPALLWMSERDGFNQLYLLDARSGEQLAQLSNGKVPVEHVIAVDDEAGWVYYTAFADAGRPFDQHLCRARLDGSASERLTTEVGDHSVSMSPDRKVFVDTWSTPAMPARSVLRSADGAALGSISTANTDGLTELGWEPPEEFAVLADDGVTTLYGVLYKPPGFDPKKRFPVVDFIYGGPQITIRPTWFDGTCQGLPNGIRAGFGARAQAAAQLGFVTVVLDGRGTPGRGVAFQEVVRGRKGTHEVADHVAALRQLAADRPWMDLDRVGITGGSWGGYMTLRAMLTAPEVYAVGVADRFVADHLDHSKGIEAVMGRPQERPDAYRESSNLPLADRLRGRLLMIQGTADVNATFSAAMKMVNAFIQAGRPVDFLPVPGMSHHPKDPQHAHYCEAATLRYLVEHLRPEGVQADEIPMLA